MYLLIVIIVIAVYAAGYVILNRVLVSKGKREIQPFLYFLVVTIPLYAILMLLKVGQ